MGEQQELRDYLNECQAAFRGDLTYNRVLAWLKSGERREPRQAHSFVGQVFVCLNWSGTDDEGLSIYIYDHLEGWEDSLELEDALEAYPTLKGCLFQRGSGPVF